ncbi:SNF2-related protein [Streptomyces rochei]|uniref:SNF2-related protein n=1 Tax=Streptomyces rochei TaxID=1928 RepID=UPI0036B2F7FD
MATVEIPEDPEQLAAWIKEREELQNKYVAQVTEYSKAIQAELAEEQAIRARYAELAKRRKQREYDRDVIKRQAQEAEKAIIQGKRMLATFESERAINERLKQEAEEFDRITAHYKWREFAFSHQIEGARRLATAKRGILGDKRGLGKSLTSLIWADMVSAQKVIVFAPKDVLLNFKREIEHWTPHRHVAVVSGMPKGQRDMFLKMVRHQPQFLILINYEAWRRDEELVELLKTLKADTIIIDEAHNIKEKKTSAYRGIKNIVYAENCCNVCGGDPEQYHHPIYGNRRTRCSVCLAEPENFGDFCSVKNVLPMTGTAILNKPQDIWTLLNLVDRELFPSEKAFLDDYCVVDLYTGRWSFRYGGEERLIKKLGSRFVKRDKNSAGVKFKKQQHVQHVIEFEKNLYRDQWEVMQQIQKYGAIKMAEDVKLDVVGILPELLRRRQAITWPAGIKIWEVDEQGRKTGRILYEAPATESIKMDKMFEIAEEIINEEEDRLVVFSQFKEALKEAERRFKEKGISVIRYDGDTSDAKAQEAQLDFDGKRAPNHPWGTDCNKDCKGWDEDTQGAGCMGYKYQVIVAHYKKGGVGLNLNAARQMIKLDREWNFGKEDQADGRIDRIDNLQDSIVHTIHVEGSIDAFMDDLIDQKKNMVEGLEASYDMAEKLREALQDRDML